MSIRTAVELSNSFELEWIEWDEGFAPQLTLDYTGHPDNRASLDIDEKMATFIIKILQKAYKLGDEK